MKSEAKPINVPVIDLFAGPGGLGEGFEQYSGKNYSFNIVFSIEKNEYAYQTLKLRSFFRSFHHAGLNIPHDYYRYLNEEITYNELFSTYPDAAAAAEIKTWQCELGGEKYPHRIIDTRIRNALNGQTKWILVGGPPCQAYSLVGRSRMKNASDYKQATSFDDDDRHVLYRQYLRIIALHSPPIFVMENVRGMLSAKIAGIPVFPMIMKDLSRPATAARKYFNGRNYSNARYRLFSFVTGTQPDGPEGYLIRTENYGIPQKRHRVILLGLREDIFPASWVMQPCLEKIGNNPSVRSIISSLPALRSGISDKPDTLKNWRSAIRKISSKKWFKELPQDIRDEMSLAMTRIAMDKLPRRDKSAIEFPSGKLKQWFSDPSLHCVCNHETRTHMTSDLWRYLFVSAFGSVRHRSPTLKDFPTDLLPAHRNAKKGQKNFIFNDRFRVQLAHEPATTVTSHISKDGHYFIHYDPVQCRSLTVREAARLQTFPDNYFFVGPRTEQYRQVGNAVPPLLAQQIAAIVAEIFEQ